MEQQNIEQRVDSTPRIQTNLVIEGVDGSLVLEKVHFRGVNVNPNGLEIRVQHRARIDNITFTRNVRNQERALFRGPLLHQTTGPGDVFIPQNVDHYGLTNHEVNQTTVNYNIQNLQYSTVL